MKKILMFSFLLISMFSFSQMDRRIGRTPNTSTNKKQEKIDPIQTALNYLKKELNLDTFQEAATKTFLEENLKEKEYILTLDISDDDKMSRLKTSYDKLDTQIKSLLNKEQKEIFTKLKEKQTGSDKKKKGKKEKVGELENQ